jgi:hypothetical protein
MAPAPDHRVRGLAVVEAASLGRMRMRRHRWLTETAAVQGICEPAVTSLNSGVMRISIMRIGILQRGQLVDPRGFEPLAS